MTRPYAEVIGDPIKHSKSPLIHGYWLEQLGIDADYRTAHVTPDELTAYIENRSADPLWRGCNVTIPHKITVMDLVGDPGEVRASIGAMNTILRGEASGLIGTNTDAGGFYAPLSGLGLEGKQAVVIGTGGAAHAILFALSRAGIGFVTILARNPLKGAALLARFGLKGDVKALDAKLPPAVLLVNATQLGMTGQPPLNIDLTPLPGDAVVYDIVYAPLETELLVTADARGLVTIDGLDMLIGQAALAFELFFGATPPDDDEALRDILTQ
jgi:shikimate dehydrogenase